MTAAVAKSGVGFRIAPAEGDGHLTLTVHDGPVSHNHQITLAQARALSLELIKHAYRAELRNRKSHKPEVAEAAASISFGLRHRHQT